MYKSISVSILLCLSMGGAALAEHGSVYGAELDHVLHFPHFGNGESTRSEIVLVNLGSAGHSIVSFHGKDGVMIAADSLVEITEDLELLEDGAIKTKEIPTLGEITISTNGSGDTVSGSVVVSSVSLAAGFLRFTLDQGVAGVASANPTHNFIVPVRRRAGGVNTGLAVHNLGDNAIEVNCTLMKDGEELDTATIELEANHQDAKFLDELFTETDTSDFVGSVNCKAPVSITGVALELDFLSDSEGVFTTLPVINRLSGADFFIGR